MKALLVIVIGLTMFIECISTQHIVLPFTLIEGIRV